MLDLMGFKREFVFQCQNTLSDFGAEDMRIEERTVNKSQRGKLSGILFFKEGLNCAPTIYVEDFYKDYKKGAGIGDLSHYAVDTIVKSMDMADYLAKGTRELFNDKTNLGVRLLSKSRNKEYLKDVPSRDVGDDFVFVAGIEGDEFHAVITYALLNSMKITKDELFDQALSNTVEKYPAVLYDLSESVTCGTDECENLFESHAMRAPADTGSAYVLSNSRLFWGACALFYPGVIDRIHELLDGDFYVLPSSVHELILISVDDQDPQELAGLVRSANRSVVEYDAVLADDLYICEAGELHRVSYGGGIPPFGELLS